MQSAQLNKELIKKNRCSECNIRSYSFCRCLEEDKLKEFSHISSEKKFENKVNIFLQQDEAKNIYNISKMSKAALQSLGKEGRKNVIENYTKDKMCLKTLEIYQSLV